jgi:hypothetical protein
LHLSLLLSDSAILQVVRFYLLLLSAILRLSSMASISSPPRWSNTVVAAYVHCEAMKAGLDRITSDIHPTLRLEGTANELLRILLHRLCVLLLPLLFLPPMAPSPFDRSFQSDIRRILKGQILLHAISQVYKARQLFANSYGKQSIDGDEYPEPKEPDYYRAHPEEKTHEQKAGLFLPLPPRDFLRGSSFLSSSPSASSSPASSSPPPPIHFPVAVRVMLSACLEYIASELIQLAGEEALQTQQQSHQGDGRASIDDSNSSAPPPSKKQRVASAPPSLPFLTVVHIQQSIASDDELKELVTQVELSQEFGMAQSVPSDIQAENRFSSAQPIILDLLKRYAWFHKPAELQSVLQQFLTGQLAQGDPTFFHRLHILPVAYLGQAWEPIFSGLDQWSGSAEHGNKRYGYGPYPCPSAAFDFIDAAGRIYPLVLECRWYACGEGDDSTGHGVLLDRQNGQLLGRVDQRGYFHWSAVAPAYFAQFCTHGWTESEMESMKMEAYPPLRRKKIEELSDAEMEAWTKARQFVNPELSGSVARESAGKSLAEIWFLLSSASLLTRTPDLRHLSMFTLYHPSSVIHEFTSSALKSVFDSPSMRTLLAQQMPPAALNLIAQYAPIALPLIPLPITEPSSSPSPASSLSTAAAVPSGQVLDLKGTPDLDRVIELGPS